MFDIRLLFENNSEKFTGKIAIKNGNFVISLVNRTIDGIAIRYLLRHIALIEDKYSKVKMPLVIKLGEAKFADKLTMIIFECICFHIIDYYKRKVFLEYSIKENDIWTEGIFSSPILLLGKHDQEHIQRFREKFRFEIYRNHFRRIIKISEEKIELSNLMTDVAIFMSLFGVSEECKDKISEVVVELVGNAGEHVKTASLLDIDITHEYTNRKTGENVYGVNIVVLNFSEQLFGTALKDKLDTMTAEHSSLRYDKVFSAYKNHEKNFCCRYTEEDFYNIASFQHRISGRDGALHYGGTGLTKLIESLENMSDAHKCYMLTGTRVVNFISEHLVYDEDNWISFNGTNDFEKCIPSDEVIDECPVFFPGTAYNLNFVIKREKNDVQ